nr:MAG TPA: hypothetical protein [Caudoviricetes sp.]
MKTKGISKYFREPEEHLQLSEILYFKSIYTIYFCTFDIKTTVSTCIEIV